MLVHEQRFLTRRIAEETSLASHARRAEVARVHFELARLYRDRLARLDGDYRPESTPPRIEPQLAR